MTRVNGTSETSGRPIRKFNPGTFQSDEEVTEQFVVRTRELGTVLEILGGNVDSPSCQHVLVVGPRGRGKTMLLARVAAELRTHRRLSESLFPVRFMEESLEVFNVADFWLESLYHLARETAEQYPCLSRDLRKSYGDLSTRWAEGSLEARARAAVLEAADRLDRRLVLMVENLQSLCEDVDDDFGWKLRQTLQSEPQVMLLASATSRFEGLDDAEQPFFELFRSINLQPLDTDECRLLWQVVSGDDVSARKIRPLQILTGGNPRLLVIVAEFARHRSLRLLMEELVTLIDEHTEYFRGHLEVLAKTERRVYVSVIDLWQPSSAGEIAKRARMDIRIVSTMLGRLVDRGALIVEGSGRKRQYSAAERIFSIYYKLRRERDEAAVVENLIKFMVVFYSGRELVDMSETLVMEAAESTVIRTGIFRALADRIRSDDPFPPAKWQIMQQVSERALARAQSTVEKELLETIKASRQASAFENIIHTVNEFIDSGNADRTQLSESFIARILHYKADAHEQLGQFQAVVATCEEVVARFEDSTSPRLKWSVAEALMDTARMRKELGDLDGAVVTCGKVVERYGCSEVLDLQWWVAVALIYTGRVRRAQGDADAAIAACEEVEARFGHSDAPRLQWRVAEALMNTATMKKEQHDFDTAAAVLEELVKRFSASEESDVQWWAAVALMLTGTSRQEMGDTIGAIVAFEEVVSRFGHSHAPRLQVRVAEALMNLGRMRKELGDLDAAVAKYEEVMERFSASEESDLQWWVAAALVDNARAKKDLGDMEGGVAGWREVVQRFGGTDVSDLQWWVALAMIDLGRAKRETGDPIGAIEAWEEVVQRYGDTDALDVQWWVALAMIDMGRAKKQLGDTDGASAAWDEVVFRFGDSNESTLQQRVALALIEKGRASKELNDIKGAIAIWDEVVERYGERDVPDVQHWVIVALTNKGMRLAEMSRGVEALNVCEEIDKKIQGLPESTDTRIHWAVQCVRALALMVQNKKEAAMEAFHSAYTSFTHDDEISIREMLQTVPNLVAAGAPERELVEILSSDPVNSAALTPLIVALRERLGETVRAPAEVREVAADVREQIDERVRNWAEATSVSPESGR